MICFDLKLLSLQDFVKFLESENKMGSLFCLVENIHNLFSENRSLFYWVYQLIFLEDWNDVMLAG